MQKFLKKSFRLLLIFLSITAIVCLVSIRKSDYFDFTKEINQKTLLMTDSHGIGINLEAIGVSNLSFGSNSYVDIKNQLQWLNNNKNFDKILLSVDEQMFSSYRDNLNNNHLSIFLNPKKILKYKASYFIKHFIIIDKMIKYQLKSYFFNNTVKHTQSKNKIFSSLSKNDQIKNSKIRVDQQFKEASLIQKNAFNDIIDFCNKNNIKLLFIKFPLSQVYINERNINKNYTDLKKITNHLPVLDFSNSILDSRFYKNQDHLNEDGIKILEKLIIAKVQQ